MNEMIPSIPADTKVQTVTELTRQIKDLLEGVFPSVWVSGEVSNLARPNSGHLYFSLKDEKSQIRAALFRGVALRMRFDLSDGLEVIARGRVSVYGPRGDYQLIIEEIEPKGVGALELALRQLKEKLSAKGYFEPGRKKPLPALPKRIALVTSPSGAAVRDMLEILGRRWPGVEIWVCGVRVQGEGAAAEIAGMIRRLNQIRPRADVLIVGRGGGSLEDLWAFNEEAVADAIFASEIPVISAVGHEIDLTIADLVADRRALTPSEAAELAVPNREDMIETLRQTENRMRELLLQRLSAAKQRWQELSQHRAFRLPFERIRESERRIDDWTERLHRAVRQRLLACQQKAEAVAAHLQSLSPLNVLARGYSLTRNEKGRVLRSAEDVRSGELLETLLSRGKVFSRVEKTS